MTQESQQVGSSQAVTSTYVYDRVGNRNQMVSQLPPNSKSGASSLTLTTTYGYNNADQMTSRSDSGSVTPFNAYTYNYNYDFNGSLISETNNATGGESTSYTYYSRNRLTQVQKQAKGQNLSTATMQYDGKNTRLLMSYGGKTTSYLQDGAAGLPVVLQETVSGQPSSSFMYPLGSTSPLFQSDGSGTGLWYNKDGLGSVRALTNSSGVVTSTNSYSAFGLNAGETGKAGNTHGFAGEQLDPTGLYFNRARYFSPSLGRFIGRDDIGEGSSSRYAYTSNNPLAYIDPTGNYQYAGDGGIDSRPVDQAPHGGDTTDFLDDLLHYDPCKGKTGIEFQFCRIPPSNPLPYVLPQTKPTTQIDLTPVIDPDLFGFKRKGGLQTGLEIALCLAILFPVSNPSINKKDKNRGTIQIQGTDITQSNKGAVKDTGNNGWMLSWSWDRYSPISVKRAMKELADLLDALTEKQQTRRRKAYNKATVYISSIKVAGEHVSYPGDPGLSDKFKGVRIDVAVYEGRAFDVDSVLGE